MNSKMTRIVSYLVDLGNGNTDPSYDNRGVCYNLERDFEWYIPDFILNDYDDFVGYSGTDDCPIDHPEGAFAAYRRLNKAGDMWAVFETDSADDVTYKQARRRFCLWLAAKIEEYYV